MTTATIEKIKKEVKKELKTELMEEFILPILKENKDPEGEYRPEFINDLKKAIKEPIVGEYSAKELNNLIS